ncbi:MAG: HIT family protein [Chlamydiota bacterium]
MTEESCIFCKIAKGEAPCHKIWENDEFIAFLSIFPNTEGFTVVTSKIHYPSYVFSLHEKIYAGLCAAAKEVGLLLDEKLGVARCAMIAEGLGIDHAHIKIIPLHGIKKNTKWQGMTAHIDQYFEKYEGYVSSHDYVRADERDLDRLARQIRKE